MSAVILTLRNLPAAAQDSNALRDSLIARAKLLELSTPYVPPPGTALEHHAAGFAQIMCSAVFVTGLDHDFAAENVGYFTAPYAERAKLGKPIIDRVGKAVHVTLPNGVRRTAKFVGDQGCVTLPLGRSWLNFKPIRVASVLPDPSTQAWPMGDLLPTDPLAPELDTAAIRAAVNAAFRPAGDDRRLCGDVEGTDHRRAIRRRYHGAHAPGKLVDGKEPDGLTAGHSDQTGRLRARATGADCGVAGRERSAREDPHRRSHAHVERPPDPRAAGSRLRPVGPLSR